MYSNCLFQLKSCHHLNLTIFPRGFIIMTFIRKWESFVLKKYYFSSLLFITPLGTTLSHCTHNMISLWYRAEQSFYYHAVSIFSIPYHTTQHNSLFTVMLQYSISILAWVNKPGMVTNARTPDS